MIMVPAATKNDGVDMELLGFDQRGLFDKRNQGDPNKRCKDVIANSVGVYAMSKTRETLE